MRLALGVALAAALLAVAPAGAESPAATAKATAPLTVTFHATGEAAFYHWDFGDGATAEGPFAEHVYAEPGRYGAVLTTDAGEVQVTAIAYRVAFEAPPRARYGGLGRFTGSIWPAIGGAKVQILGPNGSLVRGKTRRNGGFVLRARVRGTGPFRARVAGLVSGESRILLRPRIEARFAGSGLVGEPLRLVARLLPAGAGALEVAVSRNGRTAYAGPLPARLELKTSSTARFRARLVVRPAEGYLPASRLIRAAVVLPTFALGSRGDSVRALQLRLRELRYALPAVDGLFGLPTLQAVLAFQSLAGLPRTGRVDAATWRRLSRAGAPRPRFPGTHLEVSKSLQVLLAVADGRVRFAVHVSTGATGNTPVGHWRIYRKVTGWDWVLWYPMYFLRGFAVHGYPDVPAYPASHGCVRVPMWIAPRLFLEHTLGESIYIYA
jgi:N-acetylmuramoyl-L-alanine amidase